MMIMIN